MASSDVSKALVEHGLACTQSLMREDFEADNDQLRSEKAVSSAMRFAKDSKWSPEFEESLGVVRKHCLVKRILEGHLHGLSKIERRSEEKVCIQIAFH